MRENFKKPKSFDMGSDKVKQGKRSAARRESIALGVMLCGAAAISALGYWHSLGTRPAVASHADGARLASLDIDLTGSITEASLASFGPEVGALTDGSALASLEADVSVAPKEDRLAVSDHLAYLFAPESLIGVNPAGFSVGSLDSIAESDVSDGALPRRIGQPAIRSAALQAEPGAPAVASLPAPAASALLAEAGPAVPGDEAASASSEILSPPMPIPDPRDDFASDIPLPLPRPADAAEAASPDDTRPAIELPSRRTRVASLPAPTPDTRSFMQKLFGGQSSDTPAQPNAGAKDGRVVPGGGGSVLSTLFGPSVSATPGTAVYDISAKTVYLPNGERLEAHSGMGDKRDDPRHVDVSMRGATPPHVYDLTERESLFHGVAALRLNPVGGSGAIYGRVGLLAHTYMLGPKGDSNGCISFKDYNRFLAAYRRGDVKRLVVVASSS
jgi:hypothetical protein